MTYISKRVRRERRENAELVENAIIILFMHFTHSMVLSPEQFNAVVLFCLAYPTTLLSMETYFGQKLEKISRIFNNGIVYLFQKYNDRLLLSSYKQHVWTVAASLLWFY